MKQILMEPKILQNDQKKITMGDNKSDVSEEKCTVKEKTFTVKEKTLNDLPGVGPATIEKLETVGYNDLMSVAVATPGELIDATGMAQAAAKKIIATARASLDMGFESGEDILRKREQVIRISTGSKAFDSLVGGGFESGALTECYGEFGSGKTQIGHALAVNCQKQFPGSTAVYIDTESTFRPERIEQLAKSVGLDPLEKLKILRWQRHSIQTIKCCWGRRLRTS